MGDRITRKIKHGVVLVELEESILVVKYDMQQVILFICFDYCDHLTNWKQMQVRVDEHDRVLEVLDSKPETRRIKIKQLTPDKDLAQMSEDIIEKCKFIHPSRKEEIEQLLIKLRKYQLAHPPKSEKELAEERAKAEANEPRRSRDERSAPREERLPEAVMEDLDDYLELLYQVGGNSEKDKNKGLESQVRGTLMILQLCRRVVNLEVLIQNGTLMGALTRVLQEEFKKSLDLTFNILRFDEHALYFDFFAISEFQFYQDILSIFEFR